MISNSLSKDEKNLLLKLARQSIVNAVSGLSPLKINENDYSPKLQEEGASFVTLTKGGKLRGCIGTLNAYQALVQDVCEHAAAAALEDYRFPPVQLQEINALSIEISRLTPPTEISYQNHEELLEIIRPHIDGVLLKDGVRRATFLPQVWDKISDPAEFLSNLCWKMGAPENYWKVKKLEVLVYQVEEFREEEINPLSPAGN